MIVCYSYLLYDPTPHSLRIEKSANSRVGISILTGVAGKQGDKGAVTP